MAVSEGVRVIEQMIEDERAAMDMPELQRTLGDELKKPGRSQAALARALGLDTSAVNRMVMGLRQIKLQEAEKIEAYLAETDGPSPLAQKIEARMTELGSNPYRLAKDAGLGESYVRDILRGKVKDPGGARLQKLADALGLPIEELTGADPSPIGPIALRIASRLRDLKLTPITAATRAGLPRDTIRNLFRIGSSPRTDTLVAIANALDTSVAWLVGEDAGPSNTGKSGNSADAQNADKSGVSDPITIMQSESGMWFATWGTDKHTAAASTLEQLCAILPEAVRRAG